MGDGSQVEVIYPDGHGAVFTRDGSNNYVASSTIHDRLFKNADNTYSVELDNQMIYHYNFNGLLDSITDINGNKIRLTYDSNNKLNAIISPSNKTTTVTVSGGRITQITDPIGRFIKYGYDGNNHLTSIQNNEGISTYAYSGDSITTATDFNGKKYVENVNDEFGRVVLQTSGDGNITTYDYDEDAMKNTFTELSTGAKTIYEYDTNLYVKKITYSDGTYEAFTYDSLGNKVTAINRKGYKTTYTYDAKRSITSITSPSPYNHITGFTYDGNKRLTKISQPDGGEQKFTYDTKGNLTKSEIKIKASTYIATNYIYDSYGRVTKVTGAENNITTYEYLAASNQPTKVTDPVGNITTYTYDDVNRVKTITTANGVTTLEYNTSDKVVKTIDPLGNTTKIQYDAMGNLIKAIQPEQYNPSTDNGNGSSYTYDTMDRLIRQTDPLGNIFAVKYDPQGNVIKDINPNYYNSANGDGTGISYEYDKDNRKIKIINPSGQASRIKYDALGNVVQTIDANNYNEANDSGKGMTYTYDELNRLVQITNTEGKVVNRLVYDSMGRVVKSIDAEGYLSGSTDTLRYGTVYTYNLAGWLLEKRVPLKKEGATIYYNITKYDYDKLGRILREYKSPSYVTLTTAATSVNTISYTYDGNSRIKTISDSTGAHVAYTYDGLGNVIEQKTRMNSVDYQVLGYQYDASSRLIKQWTEVKGTDLIGTATGIVRAETTYEYDKNGNILSITSPEGYKTAYTYDAANRLITKSEEVSEDWLNDTNVKASITSPINRIYEGQTYTYKINVDPQEDVKGLNLILEFDSRVFEPVTTTPSVVGVTIKPGSVGRINITATNQTITSKTEIATLSLKVKPGFTGIGYINFNKYSTYTDANGKSKPLTELEGQSMDLTGPDMNNDGKVEANDLTLTALRQDMDSSHPEYEYQYDINGNSTIDLADVDYITDWIFKDKSATLQQLGHSIFTLKVINSQYQKGANTAIRTTTYSYDKAGNVVSQTDSKGQTITYVYAANNQLIKNVDKEGNTYRYFYDEVGNILKEVLPTHYNSGTDNGLGTSYIYDTMGNLTQVLDAEGNVVQTKSYNAKRQLISQVDGENNATTYTYDLGGRILTVATPESRAKGKVTASYTYDALNKITTHTDGGNHTTTYVRDLWGRATKIANAKVISEYYTYDFMGNILTSKDGKGYTTTYAYNAMNQLKTVTNPSNQRIQYKYDKEGRLAQETDKKGQVITYTYNSDSHITSKSAAGNALSENYLYSKEGRLFATITSNGIERYAYKPNGNLEKKTLNGHEQLTYSYNKVGQVTHLTDSENQSILYGYDTVGRLKTVSDGTNNLATYTYNRDNTIADMTFDTSVKTIYGYNKDNQVTGLMHQKVDGTAINSFSYTYDNSGNLTQKVENGQATAYTYDAIDQLIGVNYPSVGQETYTYDNAGNRTQKTLSGITSNTPEGELKQRRYYGEDGRAVEDIDYRHGGNHEFPHRHRWDWTKARPRQ